MFLSCVAVPSHGRGYSFEPEYIYIYILLTEDSSTEESRKICLDAMCILQYYDERIRVSNFDGAKQGPLSKSLHPIDRSTDRPTDRPTDCCYGRVSHCSSCIPSTNANESTTVAKYLAARVPSDSYSYTILIFVMSTLVLSPSGSHRPTGSTRGHTCPLVGLRDRTMT